MATTFSIGYIAEDGTIVTLVNFLSGVLALVQEQHSADINDGHGRVLRTFSVLGRDTQANIIGAVVDLEAALERARDYHNPIKKQQIAIVLFENAEVESGRNALIYDYDFQQNNSDGFQNPLLRSGPYNLAPSYGVFVGVITLTLRYGFENNSPTELQQLSAISAYGGTWDLTTSGAGVLPGRIESLTINHSITNLNRIWIGLRRKNPDIVSEGYQAAWELSDSKTTNLSTDCSLQSEPLAEGGTARRVTFATSASLTFRLTRKLEEIEPTALAGSYLVLMRCRVDTSGTTARVRLSSSFKSPADAAGSGTRSLVYQNEQLVTDTAYRLIEMGIVEVPPGIARLPALSSLSIGRVHLNIQAERLEGSGYLWCKSFLLIPAGERLFIDNANFSGGDTIEIFTGEDDRAEVHIRDLGNSSAGIEIPEAGFSNWEFPHEGARVVFAGERTTGHVLTDNFTNATLSWFPRWRRYRE